MCIRDRATGISLQDVRTSVAELSAKGEVIMCKLTRFEGGKQIDGWPVSYTHLTLPTSDLV